jgi:hypothetical protein
MDAVFDNVLALRGTVFDFAFELQMTASHGRR